MPSAHILEINLDFPNSQMFAASNIHITFNLCTQTITKRLGRFLQGASNVINVPVCCLTIMFSLLHWWEGFVTKKLWFLKGTNVGLIVVDFRHSAINLDIKRGNHFVFRPGDATHLQNLSSQVWVTPYGGWHFVWFLSWTITSVRAA